MLTHPKTSTEWGTYSFSHAPTTKSGTCPCTPLQALRLSKKWLDGPLQNEEPATNLARGCKRFSLQNQGAQSHFFGALLWFSEPLKPLQNEETTVSANYKIVPLQNQEPVIAYPCRHLGCPKKWFWRTPGGPDNRVDFFGGMYYCSIVSLYHCIIVL